MPGVALPARCQIGQPDARRLLDPALDQVRLRFRVGTCVRAAFADQQSLVCGQGVLVAF